jgi:hypothetical protein
MPVERKRLSLYCARVRAMFLTNRFKERPAGEGDDSSVQPDLVLSVDKEKCNIALEIPPAG